MTRAAARLVALVACLCILPTASAVAQAPERLLGADGGDGIAGNLVVLDPATGAVTSTVGPVGFPVTGLAVDPADGVIYGSTGAESDPQGALITINRDTGAGTLIGEVAGGDPAADLTFLNGTLFGWIERTPKDLATIDKATGAATIVGDSGLTQTRGSGLAAAPDGTLYYTGSDDNGTLQAAGGNTLCGDGRPHPRRQLRRPDQGARLRCGRDSVRRAQGRREHRELHDGHDADHDRHGDGPHRGSR